MLEVIAMSLLILWALGLVTGFSLGGAIHVLLLAAGVILLIERASDLKARSAARSVNNRALLPARPDRAPRGGIPIRPRETGPVQRPAATPLSPVSPGRASYHRSAKPDVVQGPRAAAKAIAS
jgi:hypothetical protein